MEIRLTPEQESFGRHAVDTGRFSTPEKAVGKALDEMAQREHTLAELRADIQAGINQLGRGEGIVLESTEDIREFFEDIKKRGREILAKNVLSRS